MQDSETAIADIAVFAVARDQDVAENGLAETRDVDQRLFKMIRESNYRCQRAN